MLLIDPKKQQAKTPSASIIDKLPTASGHGKKKKKLAVIGVGSAGLLSLMHFCTWLDKDWEVYSIHNPNKKILGIGESTNGGFVSLLERATHFTLASKEDMQAIDATLKFGSKFEGWRDLGWINPLLDGNTAIHFNNFRLKDFVYERLAKLWPEQFRVLEGDVKSLENRKDHVNVVLDGTDYTFDYVIDCMGFPQEMEDYHLSDCTPVNRCVIQSVTDFEFEPFTDHIAHENGWMFGVPLQSRKTYGYLYNSDITSKTEAENEVRRRLNVDELENKEYVFNCYYTKKMVDGRIARNGNKASFFEPLIANSIFLYIYAARLFYDYMAADNPCPKHMKAANEAFIKKAQSAEDIISYYYHGGSTYETPFWEYATAYTKERLAKCRGFNEQMKTFRTLKEKGVLHTASDYGFSPLTWEIIDEKLGYQYIG